MTKHSTLRRPSTDHLSAAQLSDPACEAERRELLELAASILVRAPASRFVFRTWLNAVHGLTDAACTTFSPEAALARLAAELRRLWLKTAHKAADQHMRSPHHNDAPTTPTGTEIQYGYERDLRPRALEARCADYAPAPRGWTSAHVLFSSAQGGLMSILHWAQQQKMSETARAPHVTLAGNYFETQDLLDLFRGRDLTWSKAKGMDSTATDDDLMSRIMLIEPVFFDDGVNVFDIATFHRTWRERALIGPDARPALIVLDTTLTGPMFPLHEFLAPLHAASAPIVINVHSGLKLDQAGLELAGSGIVSVYCRKRESHGAEQIADRLRRIRASTGVGLTLDEISVLEAPWFLDPRYFRRYAGAVFDNNAALAHALNGKRELFAQVLHPQFARAKCRWAKAPYCVLRLREPAPENYDLVERIITAACERRGLLFDRGGSFGFRGHRYETVTPDQGRGEPFLRIAMGARGGSSYRGIIDLMRELAGAASIEKLREAYPHAARAAA